MAWLTLLHDTRTGRWEHDETHRQEKASIKSGPDVWLPINVNPVPHRFWRQDSRKINC